MAHSNPEVFVNKAEHVLLPKPMDIRTKKPKPLALKYDLGSYGPPCKGASRLNVNQKKERASVDSGVGVAGLGMQTTIAVIKTTSMTTQTGSKSRALRTFGQSVTSNELKTQSKKMMTTAHWFH